MLPRYYDLLSLRFDATPDEVVAARERLLAKYASHAAAGDRDAVKLVRAIEEAAATLSDPARRAAYDAALATVAQENGSLTSPPTPPLRAEGRRTPPSLIGKGAGGLGPTALPAPTSDPGPPAAPAPAPAPVLFILFLVDWLARAVLSLSELRAPRGEVLDGTTGAQALGPAAAGVQVNASGWRFTVQDTFRVPALAANGQRLQPDGRWLLVRLAVRNDWPGHRVLRAEDFGLLANAGSDGSPATAHVFTGLWSETTLDAEATNAARLVLGLRSTPAGRYGLGFAAHEEKETVLVFDAPADAHETFLRLRPVASVVDLTPSLPALATPAMPVTPAPRRLLGRETSAPPVAISPSRPEILEVALNPTPGRSRQAVVTARVTPGAECQIHVQYARGRSKTRGLAPATAGPDGIVQWRWRITSRTRPGEWPVTVVCGRVHALATLRVDEMKS